MLIMSNHLITELKYNQTDINALDNGDIVIVYKGNVATVNTNDKSESNINKTVNVIKWLCNEFPGMKDTFFDKDGSLNHFIFGPGNEHKIFDAIYNFESMPRLLFGIVEDGGSTGGLELIFDNDFNYDILRSPEMRQLAMSGVLNNFNDIVINGEDYTPDQIYSMTAHKSGSEGVPSILYHGTTDKIAEMVVRKGLRPMKQSRSSVSNPNCVFLTSLFDVADGYARMASLENKAQGSNKAVLEIDGDKLDQNKIVLDWDVANQYSTDIENSPYDNISSPENNPRFHGDKFKNSDRNTDKSVRFGYQGVIMPSAIKAIYIYQGNRYVPYSLESFIDETNKVHESLSESTVYDGSPMLHEVEASEIDLLQFKPKKELNPKFWVNGKLNSRVRLKLLDIADDFMKETAIDWVKPEDIVFTGSLANYNWSKHSDVDLHIMVDYKKVDERKDFVEDYFSSKKELWLEEHPNLKIYGFPVEVYVEDTENDNPSSGIYSLEKNEWVVEPNDFQDSKINAGLVANKAADFMTAIDNIADKITKEQDEHKISMLGKQMEKLYKKLRNMRTEGLESNGEMSSGNLIWKLCRRGNYLDKIWKVINHAYDRINSIHESLDYNMINEGWGDVDSRGWLNIGIIPGYSPFMGGDKNTYLMVDPNAEKIDDLSQFRRLHTTFAPDKNGSERTSQVPTYYLQNLEIYPEYQDTYYGEVFLGKKKDNPEDIKKHEEFMSNLNIDGDMVILTHDSPVLIKDGYISAGHEKQGYSRNSDVGIYFWGSKNSGSDPSNSGTYAYYCKVPLSDIYDFQNNADRLTLKQAMSKYPYVAQYWKGGPAIVVTSWVKTPIWKCLDKRTGKVFD